MDTLKTVINRCTELFLGDASRNVVRGTSILALGNGIKALLSAALIPFLTRVYSPEDFGVLAAFAAMVMVIVPFATFQYHVPITLPRQDRLGFSLVVLALGLTALSCLVVATVVFFYRDAIFTSFSIEAMLPWWYLIAIGVFVASAYETLNQWAVRKQSYSLIAKVGIIQAAAGESSKLVLGLLSFQPMGLLVGQVVGHTVAWVNLFTRFRREFVSLRSKFRMTDLRFVMKYYSSFAIYRMPAQATLAIALQMPILFVAASYDAHVTGQVGLAFTIIAVPMAVVGRQASKAFYGEISLLGKSRPFEILELLDALLPRLVILVSPVAIGLFFFGETLFAWVFGANWRMAGVYASWLSLMIIPQFVASSVIRSLDVLARARTLLIIYLVRLLVVCVVFGLAILYDLPAQSALMMFSVAMSFFFLVQLFIVRKVLMGHF